MIFNTLSITVAQRTREFATLRTLGASRKQVMRSVVIEGLVIGLLASVVGLFAGFGLAKLLTAIGGDLPEAGMVFALRTVLVSLALGTVITLLASIVPARRATRVPPIAAVREGSTLPPSRFAAHSLQDGRRRDRGVRRRHLASASSRAGWARWRSSCCSASGSWRSSWAWPWRPRTWSSR